jgi:hypothetical protein
MAHCQQLKMAWCPQSNAYGCREGQNIKPVQSVSGERVIGKQWLFQYLRGHSGQIVTDAGLAVPTFTAIRRSRLEVVTTKTVIRRR